MKKFLTVSTLLFVTLTAIFGQVLTPVSWKFDIKKISETEYDLVYTATMKKGWNVYSQFTEEGGPVPTEITYESMDGATKVGKASEKGYKKEGTDPLFDGVNVIKFLDKEPFVITQRIKITDAAKPITGYLTYMTCNDKTCLPPDDIDFEFLVPQSSTPAPKEKTTTSASTSTSPAPKPTSDNKTEQPTKTPIKTSTPATNNAAPAKIVIKNNSVESANKESASTSDNIDIPEDNKLLNPVKWTVEDNDLGNNERELVFTAIIEKGWSTYSQFTEDNGPVPTSITYEANDGITLVGTATETGYKKEGPDPNFDNVQVIKFLHNDPFVIRQKYTLNDDTKPFTGYLTYMACDASKCLTPTDVEFNFHGKGSAVGGSLAKLDGDKIDQFIPALNKGFKNPKANCASSNLQANSGLWWTFLFGFIGGLFALLTPCVFPMIPITVSFFTKDTKRKGWMNGLIYGVSIIAIYVAIGLIITSIFGPEALNRLSTNWIANTLFFIIFIFFAFSFFGFYEITLPSSWSTKSDQMADKGGLLGIFFMAFTLALVSFSCTGPIIGTALVEAASSGSYLGPFLVMFGFSLALALPFGLFAAFPAWLNSLPRSGSWMNSVKVVLGFLELALAFKFLSVADMTNHWGILKYELFMAVWVLVFFGMTLYLFGFIKFPHDSPIKKLSATRLAFGALAAFFTLYLTSGFFVNKDTNNYNALSLMSGLAPPANYNFFLKPAEVDATIKSKYMSYTKCANDIECFKDYYDGLAYAKEQNKPILLDFTGYGCVNCRKTEEHIWVDDEIRSILKNDVVLVSLYVDDDKKLDQVLISKTRQKKLRDVGDMWADFQIVNFEQNSQPLYILISPDQEVLTAPRGYEEGIKGYKDFLDCGLNKFISDKDLGVK